MPRYTLMHLLVAGFTFYLSLGGRPPATPAAVPAQTGSAQRFQQYCAKCHGKDGTGNAVRGLFPAIPNFTAAAWQAKRTDVQLLASILDGQGADMPAWRGKIGEKQARELVAYIRAFAPTKKTPKVAPGPSLEQRYRDLEKQLDKLQKQYDELSRKSSRGSPTKTPQSSQPKGPRRPAATTAKNPIGRALFQHHCVKCHGADGTGKSVGRRLAEIPNFTDTSWQAQRSNAHLMASLLNGKGKEMPAWREKIRKDQARHLIAYVRSFVPTTDVSPQEQDEPAPSKSSQAESPACFFEQLICWLGRFHPATVHFPIALVTAAAVAELLQLVTGQPAFVAVSRYCLWFGALTAVGAGVLGWFLGGFHLADDCWVLTTHRWLGTATATGVVLLLALSEVSRRHAGQLRICFRAALFATAGAVMLTGFFGGALVFGLDHYHWPS